MSGPSWDNATSCFKCNSSFGVFTRKHHCRNCGHTFCNGCSSKQAPIPRLGHVEPVRVCEACYNEVRSQANVKSSPVSAAPVSSAVYSAPPANVAQVSSAATPASNPEPEPEPVIPEQPKEVKAAPTKKVSNCTCGLPFCICPADPEPEDAKESKQDVKEVKAEKKPTPAAVAPASSTSSFSGFSGFGGKQSAAYNLKGDLNEQCREAIKAGDMQGVELLLKHGANAKFSDRTGNTLVHLAAMFNRFDMVQTLVKAGADIWAKNPSGETAVDLAPPSLGMRMKELVQ